MRSHNQQRQARHNLLIGRARSMLHTPTPSEQALWQALRGGALGVAFKRQVVLGERYIADFFAPSVGLVVEVDGGVHRGRRTADRRRDEWLRRRGYRVVRVEAALFAAKYRGCRRARTLSARLGQALTPVAIFLSTESRLLHEGAALSHAPAQDPDGSLRGLFAEADPQR